MEKSKKALTLFKDGYNCSQAILASFVDSTEMKEEIAIRLSSAFGGGISRNGEICGAVSGALMVIGLKNWKPELSKDEAKMHVYNMSNRFIKEFKALHGSINCTELLGCNLGTEEGRKKAKAENASQNICEKLVTDAGVILEKLL